jgi:membrane associated rhomboid family serine protease
VLIPIRDENPRGRFPLVTAVLIIINAVVFLFQRSLALTDQLILVNAAGAIPYEIVNRVDIGPSNLLPWPGSIVTSMFLHGGWLHLIGNMWFLWLFGDNVEEALGRLRFALFYLLVGTIGALAQSFTIPTSTAPMIGASGAVAGVLGAYVLLYPRAKVLTFAVIPLFWNFLHVPAWLFLGLWFIGQFFIGTGSGVAWMAHVGGFLGGLGIVRLLSPSATRPAPARPVEVEYIPPGQRG